MKKIILLLAGTFGIFGANAQYAGNSSLVLTSNAKRMPIHHAPVVSQQSQVHTHRLAGKTTSVAFLTENFGSGTATSLPTGWTTGAITVGTWKWANTASTSAYTIGAMNSTTASNGWMIFNSDSIGAATSGAPAGWLQSPSYNCSTHHTVRLSFEDYYRKYEDSCYVWVSTNPLFSTYSTFPVLTNNDLPDNESTANPTTVHIDITSAAGNMPAVYIRFVTYGPTLGAYSWMIDDLSLSELDSIDVGVENSCVVYTSGDGAASFGSMPSKIIDSLFPVTFGSNYGFTPEPSTAVNAGIYQGTSSVYSNSVTVNLPKDAVDTLVDFSSTAPQYYSNTQATYIVPFSVPEVADADLTNNADTAAYIITDSIWSENAPNAQIEASNYVYTPGSAARSWSPATMFNVPAGAIDTLTSVSVAFESNTQVGQNVGAQIYHFDGSEWQYDGLTVFRALAAADISAASSISYATFPVDVVASGNYVIFNGGASGTEYAIVVKGQNNTDTVSVLESNNPAPYALIGYVGLSDTSNNNGGLTQDFGEGHLPYGEPFTPFIVTNFGVVPDYTAVKNVTATGNYVGAAIPNPANTSVTIPFNMAQDAMVTITLFNVVGQEMNTQNIQATGGKSMKATIATDDLADGVYLYSVVADGQCANGRVVVTH